MERTWGDEIFKTFPHLDLEDVIARLNWFETDVVPALDFYRAHKSHKFHEINGEQEIDKVAEDILKSIGLK